MPKLLPKKPALVREITLTLVVKLILIYFIWLWFFSNPVDEHLDDAQVHNVIFGGHSGALHQSATDRNSVEDN